MAIPLHIHFTSLAMSAPKKHDRENDFAVQMQQRKKRFQQEEHKQRLLAMDAKIQKEHAAAGNLLLELDKMLPANDAAPAGQEKARMQRVNADASNALAGMDDLFQERNAMVIADLAAAAAAAAAAKPGPAGGAAGKEIASIDLTHLDSDVEVVEVFDDDDDDDDVQIVGQRAVP